MYPRGKPVFFFKFGNFSLPDFFNLIFHLRHPDSVGQLQRYICRHLEAAAYNLAKV